MQVLIIVLLIYSINLLAWVILATKIYKTVEYEKIALRNEWFTYGNFLKIDASIKYILVDDIFWASIVWQIYYSMMLIHLLSYNCYILIHRSIFVTHYDQYWHVCAHFIVSQIDFVSQQRFFKFSNQFWIELNMDEVKFCVCHIDVFCGWFHMSC